MRPVSQWDQSDLLDLITNAVKESITLDYKRSAALSKQDREKNELSKDISAFANSAGGVLIYGMMEDRHVPTGIDVGVDRNVITKEWLESVVKSVIVPIVDDVLIKQIDLTSSGQNNVVYAIEVAQATSRAPHQANDYRYYKRFNFESTPMEDYEVRDLMRRSIEYGRKYGAAWELRVEVQRLLAAIADRGRVGFGDYLPRNRLSISVSSSLRTAGNVMGLFSKPLRNDLAKLVGLVDAYNSTIETIDPGRGEEARLNEPLRKKLGEMHGIGSELSVGLGEILEREP